jgi:glucokinase
MNNWNDYAIGVDLGGTKILASLVDQNGNVLLKKECKTLSGHGEQSVLERLFWLIDSILDETSVNQKNIRGVGFATAGVINTETNEVVYANNLGWKSVSIGKLVFDRYGLPLRLCNDGNAAAVSEWIWGLGFDTENLIYITVGTGVGSGIISGGKLVVGNSDSAGELGHISIDLNGPPCVCGNSGCLENYVSGPAIAEGAKTRLTNGDKSDFLHEKDGTFNYITSKHIGKAVEHGDSFSIHLLREIGFCLGVGVTNLIHLFNPEVIVFGGGVMNMADHLLPSIKETVDKRCIPAMGRKVRISQASFGSEAGIKGAAGLFFMETNCQHKGTELSETTNDMTRILVGGSEL